MFKGLGNIAALLKQAQNIGPQMEGVSDELKNKRVTGTAGGGMVSVHANGLGHIISIELDETLREKNDLEMVTDLLPAAINDAIAKSKQLHMEAMQGVTGDLPIPGNMENMLKQFMGGGGEEPTDDSPTNIE